MNDLSMPAFLHSLHNKWARMEPFLNLRSAALRGKHIIVGGDTDLKDGKFWTKLPMKYARNFITSRCCRGSSKRTNNDIPFHRIFASLSNGMVVCVLPKVGVVCLSRRNFMQRRKVKLSRHGVAGVREISESKRRFLTGISGEEMPCGFVR